MVPLAWALRTAGHEVLVASQPELTDIISQAGLTAAPVGRDHTLWRTANRFLTKRVADVSPEIYKKVRAIKQPPFDMAGEPAGNITWEYLRSGYDNIVPSWYKVVSEPMLDDLVTLVRFWKPDLVVWESATYAGPIAARVVGAAHARLPCFLDMFGVIRGHYLRLADDRPPAERVDALAEWLGAQMGRFGGQFSEDMTTGQFTIDQYPKSVRMEADLHYVPMRYVPYNGVAVVPRWLLERPRVPRVCLTLGTTSTERYNGYAVDIQEVLDSLAGLDIELVATLPGPERDRLARIPDNTRIVSYVPLHALMPTCSLVIHHGAFGGSNTTMLYGVPHLLLPERHDSPFLARAIAQQGAGLAIDHGEVTGVGLREHVVRLLREPSFRERAGTLRGEVLAMPTPNELVPELEKLTTRYRAAR
jgi:glycosyltransferase (activator-dependent family)